VARQKHPIGKHAMNKVQILATGSEFLKGGVRGTGPVIEEMIKSSEKEIQIMAYVISLHASKFLDYLEEALQKEVKMTIILNRLDEQDEKIKKKIKKMERQYRKLKVINFTDPLGGDLHAKVIVVDRKKAVIGSANFSWHGMSHNYEVGVQIEGDSAWKLGKLIDDLVEKLENKR